MLNPECIDLSSHTLFEGLEQEFVDEIESQCTVEVFKKGSSPYNGKSTLHDFYFLVKGRLKIYKINSDKDREFTISLLKAGDCLDLITLLDGKKHDILSEALDDVEVYSVKIDFLRNLIKTDSRINSNFMPFMAKYIKQLENTVIDISLVDTSTRLVKLIYLNINSDTHELNLINNLSQKEIASLIGSTRAVVNRHLQEYKKEGIIELERNNIFIKDLKLLQQKLISLM